MILSKVYRDKKHKELFLQFYVEEDLLSGVSLTSRPIQLDNLDLQLLSLEITAVLNAFLATQAALESENE